MAKPGSQPAARESRASIGVSQEKARQAAQEFATWMGTLFCGDTSADPDSCPVGFPPAVCLLDKGHAGMHSNGECSWILGDVHNTESSQS